MDTTISDEGARFAGWGRQVLETTTGNTDGRDHELQNSPLFSSQSKNAAQGPPDGHPQYAVPQYGLLGWERPPKDGEVNDSGTSSDDPNYAHIDQTDTYRPMPMLHNTDTPWSAFICGSQGSGKSYTLACMLENCLLDEPRLGKLPNPLAGLVFHYETGDGSTCEAASLCTRGVPVRVLVSPSRFYTMQAMYHQKYGSDKVVVEKLELQSKHLNAGRIKNLMVFNNKESSTPLYMAAVSSIIQDLGREADENGARGLDFYEFKARVGRKITNKDQKVPLDQRLDNLQRFMRKKSEQDASDILANKAGELTIIDLTNPAQDATDACLLFDICLSVFLQYRDENDGKIGQVVALDEAHKVSSQHRKRRKHRINGLCSFSTRIQMRSHLQKIFFKPYECSVTVELASSSPPRSRLSLPNCWISAPRPSSTASRRLNGL